MLVILDVPPTALWARHLLLGVAVPAALRHVP